MSEFFLEGGWTMYPTSVFGSLTVLAALLIAARPERRYVPLLVSLGVLSVISGLFGVSVGMIEVLKASAHMDGIDRSTVVLAGTAEALTNVVLAFILLTVAMMAASIGAVRVALSREMLAQSSLTACLRPADR